MIRKEIVRTSVLYGVLFRASHHSGSASRSLQPSRKERAARTCSM
jgi:hypothetical protein